MAKIVDVSKLCMGCMSELDENNSCPVCNWKPENNNESLQYLKLKTILNGKYIVGRVIGQGGFGITYLGWDINLEIKVAIKEYFPFGYVNRNTISNTVIPYVDDKNEEYIKGLEKFLEEARKLAKFNELSGIVSVKDFFTENSTAYIVMEYLDGMTFKQYIKSKEGILPFDEIEGLVTPVMDSLALVHGEGIIHRDISSDNLFITKAGQVKLLDFGAARLSNTDEKSLSVVLKPGYAPVEQYKRNGIQGPWTDIYSLAVTIYMAITGQMPPESLERIEHDEILTPSALNVQIPVMAERALMKALSVKASDRYENINQFKNELFSNNIINERKYDYQNANVTMPIENNVEADRKNINYNTKKLIIPLFIVTVIVCIGCIIMFFKLEIQKNYGPANTTTVSNENKKQNTDNSESEISDKTGHDDSKNIIDNKTSDNNSDDPLNQKEFSMAGSINNNLPIHMKISFNKKEITGTYYYDKYGTDIKLIGSYDSAGNVIMKEFDDKGNNTGIFNGRIYTAGELKGNWSLPDGSNSVPFSVISNN